jgi:hypothetical protein
VKLWAKAVGGPKKTLEMLDTLPTMPMTLLQEYLKVLSED